MSQTAEKSEARRELSDSLDALNAYFRELTAHDVLAADDELTLAREIEDHDVALWRQVLTHAPSAVYLTHLLDERMDEPLNELASLRVRAEAARKTRKRSARQALEQEAETLAPLLRGRDLDRIYRDLVLGELEVLASAPERRRLDVPLGFSPRSSGFARHLHSIRACERSAQRARQVFVNANLRLVVTVARRYYRGTLPLSDLIQEGNLGLMKAVNRFDYRRGYKFSTYATWWIRHTVGRALANKGNAVRVPVHVTDAMQRVGRVRRELSSRLGREPSAEELAEAAELSVDKIADLEQNVPKFTMSLDQQVGDDDGQSRLEVFRDPNVELHTPFDALFDKTTCNAVVELLDKLKPVESDIIRQRFGLEGGDERTLQEIADQYGLSRERIRQIQQEALGKLRRALRRSDWL